MKCYLALNLLAQGEYIKFDDRIFHLENKDLWALYPDLKYAANNYPFSGGSIPQRWTLESLFSDGWELVPKKEIERIRKLNKKEEEEERRILSKNKKE
jgi:hypothetical protein